MKKTVLFFLLFLPFLGIAGEEKVITNDCLLEGQYVLKNAYNVTASGSLLVWKPREEGLDYIIKNKAGTAFANNDASVERVGFEWDVGFRIDVGYQIPDNKMDLNLIWTRFYSNGDDSTTAPFFGGLFQVWTVPGTDLTPAETAKAKWWLKLNMLDLQMSTIFAPRSFMELKPFIALSTAWVDQKFNINTKGGSSTQIANAIVINDSIKMENDFWGIGPKAGLETTWMMKWGLSIYGNIDTSILFGCFDLKQKETVVLAGYSPELIFLDIDKDTFYLSRVNLDLNLGLRWDKMFQEERYHLALQAGWEHLFLFGQNQLMRFQTVTSPGINSSTKGDLTMQGFTFKASFAF